MTRTRHDKDHAEMSYDAHKAARANVYPLVFNSDPADLEFVDADKSDDEILQALDQQYGIDKLLYVNSDDVTHPIPFAIQERWRRTEFRRYQDITITQYNRASGHVSESGKMIAQLFVYGYYDPVLGCINEAVVVDVRTLNFLRVNGNITPDDSKLNPKEQDFLTFDFDRLKDAGAVLYHYNPNPKFGSAGTAVAGGANHD